MDSYDLFGDDGSGMLEGLADLAGTDNFNEGAAPSVAAGPRDASNQSYPQATYSQSSAQESSLGKLASFGGTGAGGGPGVGGGAGEYGNEAVFGYRAPRQAPPPQAPYPPHAPHASHAPHAPHAPHPPQYHNEPMYTMPDQQQHSHSGLSDIGSWAGGVRGYAPQAYRHPHPYHPDQQKLHQYPQQQGQGQGPGPQGMGLQGMEQAGYLQRQHYPPPTQTAQPQMYSPQQGYPGYSQMHAQGGVSRISQHMPYHQQMDINPHQYGHIQHSQQSHPHQGHPTQSAHQSMSSHAGPHPNVSPVMSGPPHQSHSSQGHPNPNITAPVKHQSHPPQNINHPSSQMSHVGPHQSQKLPNQSNIPSGQSHQSLPVHQSLHTSQSLQNHPNQTVQNVPGMTNPSHPGVPSHPVLQNLPGHPVHGNSHQTQQAMHAASGLNPQLGSGNPQMGHISPYQPSHQLAMGYNQHQVSRNLDINVSASNQYTSAKPIGSLEGGSPQYRTPFPQLSPQMSPRAQMSPRQQSSQMSPRPAMSPAKPNMSPHPHMQNTLSPRPHASNKTASPAPQAAYAHAPHAPHAALAPLPPQSTLQALEQMVMPGAASGPGNDYSFPRNPLSPALATRMPASPQQWNQIRPNVNLNGSPAENMIQNTMSTLPLSFPKAPELNSEYNMNKDVNEHLQVPLSVPEVKVKNAEEPPPPELSDTSHAKENNMSSLSEICTDTNSIHSEIPNFSKADEALKSDNIEMQKLKESESSMHDSTVPLSSPVPDGESEKKDAREMSNVDSESNSSQELCVGVTSETPIANRASPHPRAPSVSMSTEPTMPQLNLQGQPKPEGNSSLEQSNMPNTVTAPQPANLVPSITPNSMLSQVNALNIAPNSLPSPGQLPPNPMNPIQNTSMMPNMAGQMPLVPGIPPMGMLPGPYPGPPMMSSMGIGPNAAMQMANLASTMPMMGPGMMAHPALVGVYQPPISHHQERAALQQQIQEIFCMAPSPENQEKVRRFQERLNMLQQHETSDNCNGGLQCILQNPMYGSPIIDSPQVTSTTGRGRAKGPQRPRKPRAKKVDKVQANVTTTPSLDQLPVSEDCVTAGTGLITTSDIIEPDGSVELTNLDNSMVPIELTKDGKPKKPRPPRKPRERKPRPPKEPKPPKPPRVLKEKKVRAPRDPNAPKRKRPKKKESGVMLADTTTSSDLSALNTSTTVESEAPAASSQVKSPNSTDTAAKPDDKLSAFNDSTVTDFDDIPVTKIPIKELLEEAEAKREREEREEADTDSAKNSPTKKRPSGRRSRPGVNARRSAKRSSGGRRRRKGVAESDGEPDDLVTTPPPSPPPENDCDSSKRRSARHTQRKKYTDDVMLRLSDDEFATLNSSKEDKEAKPREQKIKEHRQTRVDEKSDIDAPKPNYIYINTTDEDSMIVHYVLGSRMGKRELIPQQPKVEKPLQDEDGDIVKVEEDSLDCKSNDKASSLDSMQDEDSQKSENSSEIKTVTIKEEDESMDVDKSCSDENSQSSGCPAAEEEDTGLDTITGSANDSDTRPSRDGQSTSDMETDTNVETKNEDDSSMEPSSQLKTPLTLESNIMNKKENICTDEAKPGTSKSQLVKVEPKEDETDKPVPVMIDVEEYFVKYRNFSYLHCEWKTEDELYKGDKRIFSKIKRFKQKQAQQMNIFEFLDDEPFNPDYVEAERILDVSEHSDPASDSIVKHYLVKWKSLQYEDSTWELEEDIDSTKVKQFEIFNAIPPKDKWKFKRRPTPDLWEQLPESPLYKGGNSLRPYQLEGLNWLLFSWYNTSNCILADEMGLGKTIQSLTFINSVWEYGIRGPFLVIAPLSTIPNWQRELESWTDMNVVVYHGSQQSKSMLQEYEFYYKNEKGNFIKDITKFNVLITTFEVIVTDFQDLKIFNWRLCIIDEAHRLKNRNCKLLEGLRQLSLEHRVLLSGTPLQNNVNELFSLLNFLEPSQFSSSEIFLSEFGQLKTESEVLKLQALLKPMMLRRLKDDVEKSLAPKEETIVEVELTNIQKKYYRGILERNFSFLSKGTASAANIPNLMNTMMELRKCCIHPYLLNGAEDQIQYDYKQANGEDHEAYYKALIQSSGKMVLVDKLLPKLKAGGHRVLIFSQMVRCLDILEDYLMYRKYPYERIDGRIRGNLRQEAIDRYSKPDSDRFVFLLCTKAGGLGINLTAADTVIIYDSDWNPQNDLQAQARCHRIGQQKMVKIYRLICSNTYEREMFDKASMKLGLDKAILQSMNTTQGKEGTPSKQLSKKEIEDLLKKGAYGAVMDEDAGDKFCEEDIDMILARRTRIIQMESEKGSTFSKASFASAGIRSDIDIDDPDFWKKWAKKAEIDTTEKKEEEDLLLTEPRRRTQIKRYGHDDGTVDISDVESVADSDDEEGGIGLRSKKKRDKLGKKRKYNSDDYIPRHEGLPEGEEVVYGNWARSECFKVERGLLTFGWARWDEILGDKSQFRRGWTVTDIEECARIIVLFCLRHYKGDEKIRNFIWDLIEPCENGEVTISRNHSGLHNPVPRGRNAKKKPKPVGKEPKQVSPQKWEDPGHWSAEEKYDCDSFLESSYKKHLFRHANKVLLRVRMMYYIKHEVIGDFAKHIEAGVHASALAMRVPAPVESAPPRAWWDAACDTSLLVGTFLHGYESYLAMRIDPQLCFLDKLGPPDDAETSNIRNENAMKSGDVEEEADGGDGGDGGEGGEGDEAAEGGEGELSSGAGGSPSAAPDDDSTQGSGGAGSSLAPVGGSGQWPSMQDLNTRLRRLITSYQRNYKKEELKMQQRAKKMERRERMEQLAREEAAQWRWARADEESFRRTVASYGVEFDPNTKTLRWGRFRALARLDSKSDEALTDYLKAFMAMCKRQCGLAVADGELPTRPDLRAEPIGEERAIATLERIDLLRVLREEIVSHPGLDNRLTLCQVNEDTPPWWVSGRHDKYLVLGVCKHGLGDTYHKLFCDPKMPFADSARKWAESKQSQKREQKPVDLSDDNDETDSSVKSNTDRPALRRSKRNSNASDNDKSEDERDSCALSELESLARLARVDAPSSSEAKIASGATGVQWFSERGLETRLHHIAHAVQNAEWPGATQPPSPVPRAPTPATPAPPPTPTTPHTPNTPAASVESRPRKQHIAIDVETERAKLHALLTSPQQPPTNTNIASNQHSMADVSPAATATCTATLTVKSTSALGGSASWGERDDASSGRSTPATPAPPPAHQRAVHAPTLSAALDLSSPLDLSDAPKPPAAHLSTAPLKGKLDDMLSRLMKRKNVPEPEVIVGKEKKRRKLDEIVLGLSAAKVQSPSTPSPGTEPLSVARKNPVLANVTVTPAAPPSSSPAPPALKPFSVTVTSVPSPQGPPKDLNSFLQQSLEQQMALLKQHNKATSVSSAPSTASTSSQRKQYEALLAESTKTSEQQARSAAYSQEAKVNKWLAEQAGLEDARRRQRSHERAGHGRLSGEEHVPMVHRLTGKRLLGHKAPQLKHLAQWIAENPMYDMDPKWTETVKEFIKLPQDIRPPRAPSAAPGERKKGRPPSLDPSGSGSSASSYPSLSSQNLAALNPSLLASLSGLGGFDPKTLAATLSNLTGFDPKALASFDAKALASFDPKALASFDPKSLASFDPKMLGSFDPKLLGAFDPKMLGSFDPKILASFDPKTLSSFDPKTLASFDPKTLGSFDPKTLGSFDPKALGSFDPKALGSFDPKLLASLGGFDPKNNPLLMPFSGMPNMLSNMGGGNVFANLAGLGLPGFPDMSGLNIPTSSSESSGKSKSRKGNDHGTGSKSSSNLPSSSASQFPFLFPNPNLLYPQLGLGGMSPYGSVSSAYDALAQCGLLNGGLPSGIASTAHSAARASSKVTPARASSVSSASASASSRHQKAALERQQQAQLQQLLLPHDTYLLESLSKQASNYEAALKADKRKCEERREAAADLSKSDKRKSFDYRSQLPPEFSAVQERLLKSSKGDKKDVDISKMLFEQMASGALSASLVSPGQAKRSREVENKDAFEKLSKTSAEYIARSLSVEDHRASVVIGSKRSREDSINEPENLALHSSDSTPSKRSKDSRAATPVSPAASPRPPSTPRPCSTPHRLLSPAPLPPQLPTHSNTGEMDLEDLIAPSTVLRTGHKPIVEDEKRSDNALAATSQQPLVFTPHEESRRDSVESTASATQHCDLSTQPQDMSTSKREEVGESIDNADESKESNNEGEWNTGEESEGGVRRNCGGRGGKRRQRSAGGEDTPAGTARRELRSSAGRQAAAAAARHAAAAAAAQPHQG